ARPGAGNRGDESDTGFGRLGFGGEGGGAGYGPDGRADTDRGSAAHGDSGSDRRKDSVGASRGDALQVGMPSGATRRWRGLSRQPGASAVVGPDGRARRNKFRDPIRYGCFWIVAGGAQSRG